MTIRNRLHANQLYPINHSLPSHILSNSHRLLEDHPRSSAFLDHHSQHGILSLEGECRGEGDSQSIPFRHSSSPRSEREQGDDEVS